jgi:2-succinyl-5-enolpyruvyl-6-hydroxy-3-cyclohexene-1-carboxylate synthase
LRPTAVLQIGNLPTSKVLRAWLSSSEPATFLLTERPVNTDPLHQSGVVLHGAAHDLAVQVSQQGVSEAWLQVWLAAEWAESERLEAVLSDLTTDTVFEGQVAWLLAKQLPMTTSVYLASSMSVRYAEYFWGAGNRAYSMQSNRGANGIDGTLGTAMGVAHRGAPSVLLAGDLAFLHDSNALLAASQLKGSLTIVLINNSGGGIFEHLPVADQADAFEDYFATPQTIDFEQLAQAHSVDYERINDLEALSAAISSLPERGLRILEVQTSRQADCQTLRQILGSVRF